MSYNASSTLALANALLCPKVFPLQFTAKQTLHLGFPSNKSRINISYLCNFVWLLDCRDEIILVFISQKKSYWGCFLVTKFSNYFFIISFVGFSPFAFDEDIEEKSVIFMSSYVLLFVLFIDAFYTGLLIISCFFYKLFGRSYWI